MSAPARAFACSELTAYSPGSRSRAKSGSRPIATNSVEPMPKPPSESARRAAMTRPRLSGAPCRSRATNASCGLGAPSGWMLLPVPRGARRSAGITGIGAVGKLTASFEWSGGQSIETIR